MTDRNEHAENREREGEDTRKDDDVCREEIGVM